MGQSKTEKEKSRKRKKSPPATENKKTKGFSRSNNWTCDFALCKSHQPQNQSFSKHLLERHTKTSYALSVTCETCDLKADQVKTYSQLKMKDFLKNTLNTHCECDILNKKVVVGAVPETPDEAPNEATEQTETDTSEKTATE